MYTSSPSHIQPIHGVQVTPKSCFNLLVDDWEVQVGVVFELDHHLSELRPPWIFDGHRSSIILLSRLKILFEPDLKNKREKENNQRIKKHEIDGWSNSGPFLIQKVLMNPRASRPSFFYLRSPIEGQVFIAWVLLLSQGVCERVEIRMNRKPTSRKSYWQEASLGYEGNENQEGLTDNFFFWRAKGVKGGRGVRVSEAWFVFITLSSFDWGFAKPIVGPHL